MSTWLHALRVAWITCIIYLAFFIHSCSYFIPCSYTAYWTLFRSSPHLFPFQKLSWADFVCYLLCFSMYILCIYFLSFNESLQICAHFYISSCIFSVFLLFSSLTKVCLSTCARFVPNIGTSSISIYSICGILGVMHLPTYVRGVTMSIHNFMFKESRTETNTRLLASVSDIVLWPALEPVGSDPDSPTSGTETVYLVTSWF